MRPSKADPELWLACWKKDGFEDIQDLIALFILHVDDLFYMSHEDVILKHHAWIGEDWPRTPLECIWDVRCSL